MKEMVYSKTRIVEVLDRGTYKDYDYVILSLGTHPCAYVRIPEHHPYYSEDYNNLYISLIIQPSYMSHSLIYLHQYL